jgi:hypothetical protein
MHIRYLLAVMLALAAAAATAKDRPYDAAALARYDLSYGKCESRFPYMQGHKDEAYLNLWRIGADARSLGRLAQVRSGAPYKAERARVVSASAKPATQAASSPLERQCQGLWAEFERTAKARKS